jgi:hypothetical protein
VRFERGGFCECHLALRWTDRQGRVGALGVNEVRSTRVAHLGPVEATYPATCTGAVASAAAGPGWFDAARLGRPLPAPAGRTVGAWR